MQNNYSNYDLNLTELEHITDPDEIVSMFKNLVQADSDFKIFPARQWVDNFVAFAGAREVYNKFGNGTVVGNSLLASTLSQGAQPLASLSRRKIPKAFKACQVQAANITRQRPTMKVWPEADEEVSIRKAKLANILVDYMWDADHEDDVYYECLLWALLTPLVARKDCMDYSFNKSRIWPEMRDTVNPMTGQPDKEIVMGQDGQPILRQHPWNLTEIVPSFRLIVNPAASWDTSLDYAGDISMKRMSWIEQNYLRDEEGYHPENVSKIKKGIWMFTPIMAVEAAIKQLTFGIFRAYRNFNYSNTYLKDGVTHLNFFIEPSPNFPSGREICIGNGTLLYDGKSRVYRETPEVWHPYSFLCYERVPGRMWGTTYMEKIVDINRAYEQARTEFDQLRRTFSKPKMRIPIGAQVERDTITGEEQIYRYNPYGPDGGKPDFMNVPNPPSTIIDDIKLTSQEFVEISGVTEIMQGIRPQGVTTYRGLEVLREEASNVASPLIRMYENFITRSQFNKLENVRRSMTYPDANLMNAIKIFKKMTQYVTDIDIVNFAGSDLAGYVKVEPMSSIGKSRLAQQEKYISLAQMGILGDIANDPDLNNELKRKMDIMGFDRPQNKQVIFARYENQMMLAAQDQGQPIVPPVEEWHDDPLHIRECEALLLDPTLQDKPLIMMSVIKHRILHMNQLAAKQMKAAMMAIGPGGGNPLSENKNMSKMGGKPNEGVMFGPETGFATNPESGGLA